MTSGSGHQPAKTVTLYEYRDGRAGLLLHLDGDAVIYGIRDENLASGFVADAMILLRGEEGEHTQAFGSQGDWEDGFEAAVHEGLLRPVGVLQLDATMGLAAKCYTRWPAE